MTSLMDDHNQIFMTSQEGVTAKENVENRSRDVYFSVEGRDVARNDHDRAVRLAGLTFLKKLDHYSNI